MPYESDDEDPQPNFRVRRPLDFEMSSSKEEAVVAGDKFFGPPERWKNTKILVRKCIDDFSAIEKVPIQMGASHHTTMKNNGTD